MTKVMLVEDDDNLREIYGARLIAEGYEIISAKDGEEALALAIKEKPELLISDVMMPKISGFDMLDILRSSSETKNIKVIMMTALSQTEDKDRADKLGADRYLVKSQVTLEDVVKVAQEVLEGAIPNKQAANEPIAPITGVDLSTMGMQAESSSTSTTAQSTPTVEPAQPQPNPAQDTASTVAEPPAAQGAPINTNVSDDTDTSSAANDTAQGSTDNTTASTVTEPSAVADTPVDDTTSTDDTSQADTQTDTNTQPEPTQQATNTEPVAATTPVEVASDKPAQPADAPAVASSQEATVADVDQVKVEVAEDAQTTNSELKAVEEQINDFVQTEQPAPLEVDEPGQISINEDGSMSKIEPEPAAEAQVTEPVADTPVQETEPPTESLAPPAPTESDTLETAEVTQANPVDQEASTQTPDTTDVKNNQTDNLATAPEVSPETANPAVTQKTETDTPKTAEPKTGGQKVIQPLNDVSAGSTDINELLKKEMEKEQLSNIIQQAGSNSVATPPAPTPPSDQNSANPAA